MKFKYNFFLERKLWKLAGEYSYQVCENNYFHTPQGIYGTDGFRLSDQEWITFTFSASNVQVHYQKGQTAYQKILDLPKLGEIIFEFLAEDEIN